MSRSKASILCLVSICLAAFAIAGEAIPNWPAPATWSPARSQGGATTMGDVTNPLPFIGVTPCRLADTRGSGFTGAYGPPSLGANAIRNFTIGGRCEIPTPARAVSFNFTVTNNPTFGDIRVYPTGGTALVSTLNWGPNTGNVANGAVVALSAGGAITVQVDGPGPLDLVIDVNGYYSKTSSTPSTFEYETTGPIAIAGFATGPGLSYGVVGEADSTVPGSAGVWGKAGTSAATFGVLGTGRTGVRGESEGFAGVLGSSRFVGVIGNLRDSNGTVAEGYLGSNVGAMTGGPPWGVFSNGNLGATGTKNFVEPHPTDPSKVILYSSLEGPEVGTYFRGTAWTVEGEAVIEVPEHFRMVADEAGLTVQLTPVGPLTMMSVESENLYRIVVRSSRDVTFHYLVQGVRRAFKDFEPVVRGMEFAPRSPEDRIPAYLTEEAKRRLIANGTYNQDGTVNMQTAERVGWTQIWKERGERDKALAAANATPRATASTEKE